jgi:hypothetical protein
MLYEITRAEARPGYRLWLRFHDGVEGEVSLAHLVGRGVFKAWQDEAEFAKVRIDPDSGTVSWPGGIDLAPDALYRRITEAEATSAASFSA